MRPPPTLCTLADMKLHIHLLVALSALALPACISETESSAYGGANRKQSYGSIVEGSLQVVWGATRQTLMSRGSDFSADNMDYQAEATISGARVTVACERFDDTRTILRISASKDGQEHVEIAEKVQIDIQRKLMH